MGRGITPTKHVDGSIVQVGAGLIDMMASTARGAVRGTLGIVGDIESLYDMGRAYVTGEPQRKNVVPNTQDFDKILPPATPVSTLTKDDGKANVFDEVGSFLNLPIYGAATKGIVKGGSALFEKATSGGADMSRRTFLKQAGAIGGSVAVGGGLVKFAEKVIKEAPVATKTAEKAAPTVVRGAYKFNTMEEYINYLRDQSDLAGTSIKEIAELDEGIYKADKMFDGLDLRGDSTVNDFSPELKAQMKAFKEGTESRIYDDAYGNMMDENPHMENFPDQSLENLHNQYMDNIHWSDYLDQHQTILKQGLEDSLGAQAGAIGLGGTIVTVSKKLPMPAGLKDKLSQIMAREGYTKRSQLIMHPDNWFHDEAAGVTYSYTPRGVMAGVSAKGIPEGQGAAGARQWLKKSLEVQFGRPFTDEEVVALGGPKAYKGMTGQGNLKGSWDSTSKELHISTDQTPGEIHNVVAHEHQHATENILSDEGHLKDLDHISVTDSKGELRILEPAEGSNVIHEVGKMLKTTAKKKGVPVTDLEDGFALAHYAQNKDMGNLDVLLNEYYSKAKDPKDVMTFTSAYNKLAARHSTAHTSTILHMTMSQNVETAKKIFPPGMLHAYEKYDETLQEGWAAYKSNTGEVWARKSGNLAQDAKEAGSFDNYKMNLNLVPD